MSFYLPLTLGVRRTRPAARDEEQREAGRRASPEAWREGLGLAAVDYEEHPATRVLEDLRRAASAGQARRPWFILGEPGAGKSTLLERWFGNWVAELPEPRLGLTVPGLVRLRELRPADLAGDAETTADSLWREHGVTSGGAWSAGRPTGERIYRPGRCRAFQPVWLLDGLDELDAQLREDARLFERLVVLPGAKLITCRTAVYEMLRERAAPHKEREFEILPLKPAEQESFLAGVLEAHGRDPSQGKVVHKAIQSNAAVRVLAGNPLMLSLIVEVSDRMALPATRAAFYREVVEAMWHRKLPRSEAERLLEGRDGALIELAQEMALERVEHTLVALKRTSEKMATGQGLLLRDALERAGLLRVDPRRGVFGFVHLTLQEFYWARAMEPGGVRQPLERHWADARYEETLALLASLLLEAGRATEVDRAVFWLLKWGSRTHRQDPRILWQKRRSPLRVALHILRRAGASWEELPRTASWLERRVRFSRLGWAVAADSGAPARLLAALARDRDTGVRDIVARNFATPLEVLAALARDNDANVRCSVAENSASPTELLAALARDNDARVRNGVAGNSASPTELLAFLARDNNWEVRAKVAQNSATPVEVLAILARDNGVHVRAEVAQNSATPPEVLAALARDNEDVVREGVVSNSATPVAVLATMAGDVGVRQEVVPNWVTPVAVRATLARYNDNILRNFGAANSATPTEAFAVTPAEVLVALAHDWRMRRGVASNSATPAEVLDALARDVEYVVAKVAWNSATPPEALAFLARHPDAFVRTRVALNSATPPEVLAALARDNEVVVRAEVARNSATPVDVLAALAHDKHWLVRAGIVSNPNVLLEDFVSRGVVRWVQTTWGHLVRYPAMAETPTPRDGSKGGE